MEVGRRRGLSQRIRTEASLYYLHKVCDVLLTKLELIRVELYEGSLLERTEDIAVFE